MQNEKLQITFSEGCEKGEIIIREVDSVNELPVIEPIRLAIIGTINSVSEFLSKRISESDQINQKRCHILVDRQLMAIQLITAENNHYLTNKVVGTLQVHPKFKEFGINTKKDWVPNELGQFFKMNRAFFVDKSENMKIVSDLKNFRAKVDQTVEKQKLENGTFNDVFSGIVTSNLPGTFKLKLPLFKGQNIEEIEVEIYASINGRDISLQLFSPGANQAMDEIIDSIIDEQLLAIRQIAPEIAIIEQ